MKSKKGLLLFALIIVLVVVIVGCSSSANAPKDTVNPPQETTKKETSSSPAPSPEPIVEPVKFVSLVDQVKESGHGVFFGSKVALGAEGAKKEHYSDACISCHSEVAIIHDKDAKFSDFLSGGKYEGRTEGITCIVCHTFEGKEMVDLRNEGWDSCGVCHTGHPTVGKEVHHPQIEFIKGEAIGNVATTPSFKYENMRDTFSCTSCHVTNSERHTWFVPGGGEGPMNWDEFKSVFKQDSCVSCHGNPDGTVEKLKKNTAEISNMLEEVEALYKAAQEKIKDLDKENPKAKIVGEAGTYYTFVEADSSKGVHNYRFAKSLLEKAETMLKDI